MKIFKRLLRRAAPLTADTPDGTYVEISGIARALDGEETIVPPVSGIVCVVARIRYAIPVTGAGANNRTPPTKIERFHNRPFELETDGLDVIIDSPFLDLDVVERREAMSIEESVPEGARITVRGMVQRDVDRPDSDASFRETQFLFRITGTEDMPVEITASVSDDERG